MYHDQAEQLRMRIKQRGSEQQRRRINTEEVNLARVITVTSGKGGVGKSNFSINFGISLQKQQNKVLIIDIDIGFANIDVLIGYTPNRTLFGVIEGHYSLADAVEEGPEGVHLIAGGSGMQRVPSIEEDQLQSFIDQLQQVERAYDYVILDTGAGLSKESLQFILASEQIILISTPEPTSITDAYALMKMIHQQDRHRPLQLVVNRCVSTKDGEQAAHRLKYAAQRFLDKSLPCLGVIPSDDRLLQAVQQQVPCLLLYPRCPASRAIEHIVNRFTEQTAPPAKGLRGIFRAMFKPFSS